jgi:hypothetical protein
MREISLHKSKVAATLFMMLTSDITIGTPTYTLTAPPTGNEARILHVCTCDTNIRVCNMMILFLLSNHNMA